MINDIHFYLGPYNRRAVSAGPMKPLPEGWRMVTMQEYGDYDTYPHADDEPI